MLTKPDLQDEKIITCLQVEYGVSIIRVAFLPLGADLNTAVYRLIADDETPYFLKLRGGVFDETSVTLPKFLGDQGITQIITPLTTRTGQLWANLDVFTTILYPFVEGHNGYEAVLSDHQWHDFGSALKRIHTIKLPPSLLGQIRRETFSPMWRNRVRVFLEQVNYEIYDDLIANKLAVFLKSRHEEIGDILERADRYAFMLQSRSQELILCHADIHAGNILVNAGGALYIVDWDDPILAPKERDLMFIGGGQGYPGYTVEQEETLFYRGYGQTEIDPIALAYYRYERIIQDIAIYCQQLLLTNEGGEDREQSFQYLISNFLPGGTIKMAYRADKTLKEG